jgi:hypothetical protein
MFDSADFWITLMTVIGLGLAAYAGVLWVALIMWTYRDARARMIEPRNQVAAALLVAVFNIPGLLLYLALRPQEQLSEAYSRQLEAEAFLQEMQKHETCRGCRRAVDADFISCPYCRTVLQEPCRECGRTLQLSWIICPYCTSEREPAAIPAAARRTSIQRYGEQGLAASRNGDGRTPTRVRLPI